jgi:hypothetical protein
MPKCLLLFLRSAHSSAGQHVEEDTRPAPKHFVARIKEDLDTHFAGILSVIRTFRNQSGHPTGRIIDREQAYVLLQLFIPHCRKMYQLRDHLGT